MIRSKELSQRRFSFVSGASLTRLFACCVMFAFQMCCSSPCLLAMVQSNKDSQVSRSSEVTDLTASSVGLEPLPSQTWEIGLEITAIQPTSNIRAVFPVPVDWTDQSATILNQSASPQVSVAQVDREKDHVRWMKIVVPQLAAGDSATVLLSLQIDKQQVTAPADPSTLVMSDKPPKDVKQWLLPSPLIESRHRKIRELAKSLPIDETAPAWNQVEVIYDWVRENIEYKFETQNRSCLECLETKIGDCGEMSGLFIALCRARGVPARAVWIPEHTYPEFYLEDAEGNGHWFPCQAAGSRNFGGMLETRPILQKGDRFRVPGNREELRYLQPTLICDGAASVRFIIRDATPQSDNPARGN